MEPRTKLQKRVALLSAKLPILTEKQKRWAYDHTLHHVGFRTKKYILCTECGEKSTNEMKMEDDVNYVCPKCGCHLTLETSRKQSDREIAYFAIITKVQDFQVVRYFFIGKYCKAGQKADYFIQEVIQRWLLPNGKYITFARLIKMCSFYCEDPWVHSSEMEIRPRDCNHYYVYEMAIYPVRRYLPELKRNGFNGNFYKANIFDFFYYLLTKSEVETILKAGQFEMLQYLFKDGIYNLEKLWPSIKICIRNNYKIKDASLWKDYIYLLEYFKKDLRNVKYVCPEDLKVEHDRLVDRKRDIERKERNAWEREMEIVRRQKEKERMEREKKATTEYLKDKANYLDILFSDGEIEIKVLQNIQEFKDEGEKMGHCVYSNEYYLRKDSLILSARIREKRIETIEVSLKNFSIIQSRGKYNQDSKYHNRILSLVEKNMKIIKRASVQRVLEKQSEIQNAC